MLVSRVSFKKGRSEKRCGCCLFVSFPPQNTNGWWKNKKNKLLKRRRIKTRIYVLLDIKNSKPTHTCTRSNVRTMGVVATVDFFFAMVVCFAAAFFLSRRDSLLLLRTIFPPSLPPPFFHLSLSLISSFHLSLSLSLFLSSCSLESFRSISFLTLFARFHCCCWWF